MTPVHPSPCLRRRPCDCRPAPPGADAPVRTRRVPPPVGRAGGARVQVRRVRAGAAGHWVADVGWASRRGADLRVFTTHDNTSSTFRLHATCTQTERHSPIPYSNPQPPLPLVADGSWATPHLPSTAMTRGSPRRSSRPPEPLGRRHRVQPLGRRHLVPTSRTARRRRWRSPRRSSRCRPARPRRSTPTPPSQPLLPTRGVQAQ